ncbi:hypothetical protein KFL_001880170 [Klebsormidium nitens]|uniref:MYND-type domain-containing protein n=1 Tax=Klebsormidium nitens TaxID=105231 RepID=A0A1Y1I1S3_KLENI|nr:hypothetical protein KFL_001880170 [Klebsormidium nitens]|eukprot:GAQ84423.1 hypothetical protein KFL_001880170 [Klebsormidium nitens]
MLDRAEILIIGIAGTRAPYGYNIALGGARGKHSEATKKLIDSYHVGKVVSADVREKLRLASTGRKITEATRVRLSSYMTAKYAALDHQVYVFDCFTHRKVFESPTRSEALKRHPELTYTTLRRSLVSPHYKFKFGGSWCYARSKDKPEEGIFHRIGKPVRIVNQHGSTQLFANLVEARNHLNVKRGVIEGCIQRQSLSSYTLNEMLQGEQKRWDHADGANGSLDFADNAQETVAATALLRPAFSMAPLMEKTLKVAEMAVNDLVKARQGRRALCVAARVVSKRDPRDLSLSHKARLCVMVSRAAHVLKGNSMKLNLTVGDATSLDCLFASNHHLLLHDIPLWFCKLNDEANSGTKALESWQGEYITDIAFIVLKLLRSPKYLFALEDSLKELGASDAVRPMLQYMRLLDRPWSPSTDEEGRNFRRGARDMLNFLNTGYIFFQTKDYDLPLHRVRIDMAADMYLMCAACFATKPKGLAGPDWQKLHLCSRCKTRAYCSKECSANDWKEHKVVCRRGKTERGGRASLRVWEALTKVVGSDWWKSVDDILLDMTKERGS